MEMEQKVGLMEQDMKDNIMKVKKMEMVLYILLMALNTKEISILMIFMGKGLINGQMGDFMMVNGKKIRWMVKVKLNGLMVNHMKVNIKMIKNMVRVYFNGRMVENIQDNGTKVNKRDSAHIYYQMAKGKWVNGNRGNG